MRTAGRGGLRVAHITTVDLTLRFLLLPQLRRLQGEGYEVTAISAPGPWVDDLRSDGIRHVPWPHASRAWDPLADGRAIAQLVRILRRERFDLVHTHNPKPGVVGRIAARLTGVPAVVNTVHGLYVTPDDPAGRRFAVLALERLAARFSDLELYQSEEDMHWARRVGIVRPAKSVLLGNGTDLSWFDPSAVPRRRRVAIRQTLGIPSDAVVVGTIGRLVREKGYRELFAAARAIRTGRPELRFLVVGSPDVDKADVLSESEIGRARPDVIFAGWREDVRDLLGAMDVFVLPSWREGIPRSAIEAAAMGLPLVVTNIRGCREVVRQGVEGLLVPPRDPVALGEAISRMVADPDLRHRMGRAARARAVERFDEQRVEETVVDAYARLLRAKGLYPQEPTPPSSVRVRPAQRSDAPAIAGLHRRELPDSFLPRLGDRFLGRMYRALAADPSSVVLVAENHQGLVGFAAGAASVAKFFQRFRRRHGIPAVVTTAPRLLRRDVRVRLRETAGYPARTEGFPEAELLAIAVAPAHSSRGVGSALVRGVLDGLSQRGARDVRVTVAASNATANRFYRGLGFRLARVIHVHGGVPSNVWVRDGAGE